ncbi:MULTISPECIES: DUF2254 domain-containing protein [Bacillaceae]|uniref:DUF2254 domain-containing protein n=1 Tax=Evansella alkalicola TaxID=745819 RepID=A0ABS6JMV5_9BACI|nr:MULTISPECIES: DUF2254 domain-containing protein [Bacillaceae]MBU9719889.1 DUF2254 domain-containing protein [Bacillus alkalicola]
MKYFLLQIKQTIWLLPSLYCLFASLLAFGVIYLDTVHGEAVTQTIPPLFLISVDLAQTILGTIAAALLTMITITFSTIMVVLTTYSSQFSPRTLSDFITNKVTMRVLGVYMGGIMYSILTLLFMREDLKHEVIAGPIGVLIAIICLAFFAYFIHHVANSIQVSNLINKVTTSTLKAMEHRLTPNKDEVIKITWDKPSLPQSANRFEVKSDTLGYIQLHETHRLLETALDKKLVFELTKPVGAFVKPGDTLMIIYYQNHGSHPKLDFRKYIKIGNDRTMFQDVEFGIRKIVEVTLRAISPGINDPNTAVDCILHLGKLLAEVSKYDGSYLNYYHDGEIKVTTMQTPFKDILYGAFFQICHYGREDISILLAMYDALITIVEEGDPSVEEVVRQFSEYINANFNKEAIHEMDMPYLNRKKERLGY